MSLSEQPSTLSSRLSALAQRLGLIGRGQRQVLERASQLRLPFSPLPALRESICWQDGLQLQRLVDLPRNALSGPVQEDKAQAHATLIRVVEAQEQTLSSFDLRLINGLSSFSTEQANHTSFETFAGAASCRAVRIISYKDFVKTISLALPRFLAGDAINLRQAHWRNDRLFWSGEHHAEAFACAIAYARMRGLEVNLPAVVTRYRLSKSGLHDLQQHYHVLAMPHAAWSEPAFMALLLDSGLPYARLSLMAGAGSPEFLLLPKHSAEATALGEGLRLAGAPDVVAYLRQLQTS